MSVLISNRVWRSSKQSGDRLLLLLALADFASDEGVCWPSRDKLAERARCSVRWVYKMIQDLEKAGEIKVEKQGGGRGNSCTYRLLFPDINPELHGINPEQNSVNSTTINPELCDINPELHNTKAEHCVPTNHHRTIIEPSKEPSGVLPLPFDSTEFREAWNEWQKHRQEKRQKLTPSAIKAQFKLFTELGEAAAIVSIQTSIRNGWTGVFPPKGNAAQPIEPNGHYTPTPRRDFYTGEIIPEQFA